VDAARPACRLCGQAAGDALFSGQISGRRLAVRPVPGVKRWGTPAAAGEPSLAGKIDQQKAHPLAWNAVVKRAVLVGFAGLAIHLVFPAITEVLASWPRLSTLDPRWFALAVAAEVAHFACPHPLPRLAHRSRRSTTADRSGDRLGRP